MQTCAPHAFVLQSTHTHTHFTRRLQSCDGSCLRCCADLLTLTGFCCAQVAFIMLICQTTSKLGLFLLLQTGEQGRLVCRYVMAWWSRAGVHGKGGDTPLNHTHTKEEKPTEDKIQTLLMQIRKKLVHFRPKKETWNITQQQYGNMLNMRPCYTKPWWVESEPLATTLFWYLHVAQVTWSTHRFQHLSRSRLCPHVFQQRARGRRTMFHPSLVFLFTWN